MSRSFFRSTAIVGAATLLSRITGMVRDAVYLAVVPTAVFEVFVVANQIPNLLRRLFAEGAFSQAFVPVVAEYEAKRTRHEMRELVESAAGTLGTILLGVSIIGVIAAPLIVLVFAPGFRLKGGGQFGLAIELLHWTFPYVLFVSLASLAGGVLNSYRKFALPAISSVILNLTMIVFASLLAPRFSQPVFALALGVFVGGILQLSIQVPALLQLGVLRWPRWNPAHEAVRRILKLMGPAIIGSSMGQLSMVLSTAIASLLANGSVAWLYGADRLVEFPLGVFSIALATVILPSLSSSHARESREEFSATLHWALRLVCAIVVPASVALFALAGPITVVIFFRGEFTAHDAEMTGLALMAFSLALLGWSYIKVLAPGYYARQDTKGPVRVAVRSLAVTMLLNLMVVVTLVITGTLKSPGAHAALALTNGIGAVCNALWLYRGLVRGGILLPERGGALIPRVLLASGVMAAALRWFSGDTASWIAAPLAERLLHLSVLIAGGAALYFACLWVTGVRLAAFRLRTVHPAPQGRRS